MTIPKRTSLRIIEGIKRFQPIILSAKSRDLNESDTVTIITDMLHDIFGYDKYSEITSEHSIRGTYVDLAVILENNLQFLLEAKAIGIDLKESHTKQAIDYASNKGTEWVILSNAETWRVYKVKFGRPIEQELVLEFNFSDLNHKQNSDIEKLYLVSREGWKKSEISEYHQQRQALDKFSIGAVLLSEASVSLIRKELKKLSPKVKIDTGQIKDVLCNAVLKREIVDGERAKEAQKKIGKTKKTRKTKIKEKLTDHKIQEPILTTPLNLQEKAEQKISN